jgi:hypothetical protein
MIFFRRSLHADDAASNYAAKYGSKNIICSNINEIRYAPDSGHMKKHIIILAVLILYCTVVLFLSNAHKD